MRTQNLQRIQSKTSLNIQRPYRKILRAGLCQTPQQARSSRIRRESEKPNETLNIQIISIITTMQQIEQMQSSESQIYDPFECEQIRQKTKTQPVFSPLAPKKGDDEPSFQNSEILQQKADIRRADSVFNNVPKVMDPQMVPISRCKVKQKTIEQSQLLINSIMQSMKASIQMRDEQMRDINQTQNIGVIQEECDLEQLELEFNGIKSIYIRPINSNQESEQMQNPTADQSEIEKSKVIVQQLLEYQIEQEEESFSGILYKKSDKLFVQYKRKYCIIANESLKYFNQNNKSRVKGLLNFQLFYFEYFSKMNKRNLVEEFGYVSYPFIIQVFGHKMIRKSFNSNLTIQKLPTNRSLFCKELQRKAGKDPFSIITLIAFLNIGESNQLASSNFEIWLKQAMLFCSGENHFNASSKELQRAQIMVVEIILCTIYTRPCCTSITLPVEQNLHSGSNWVSWCRSFQLGYNNFLYIFKT